MAAHATAPSSTPSATAEPRSCACASVGGAGTPPEAGPLDLVALGSTCVDQIFTLDDIMRLELTDRSGTSKKYLAIEVSTKLNVRNVAFYPGGSAANIAVDLSFIGLKTAFFGGIGRDPPGQSCKGDFTKNNVNIECLAEFSTATGLSVILITPWGRDRSIMAFKGSSDLYSKDFVKPEVLLRAKCFVWTSLTSDSGIGAIEYCLDLCRANNIMCCGAPSISIIQRRKAEAIKLLQKSKITSLNEEELEALTGQTDIRVGIDILLGWGLTVVQITMGKLGAYLAHCASNKLVRTKPPPVTVTDTTGAGDASMAGLIYGLLNNKEPHICAQYAAAMSAMEIETVGCRKGLPNSLAELEAFIASRPIVQEITPLNP
ncbi:carbohydrate kinase family protein [Pelomyxa schiedti]|nr:carbohydrate kinase family protein [Pelomyxa schiedti]